jgi:hypothetical protein
VQGNSQPPSGPGPLVGHWIKVAGDPGTEIYPQHLRFAGGTYLGERGESQVGLMWWDAGIYRLERADELVLSTANDELVRYQVRIEGDNLHVVDPNGRSFDYRRA